MRLTGLRLFSLAQITASKRRTSLLTTLLAFGLLFNIACGGDSGDGEVRAITFMAGFKAQANLPFVGVYVAQEKGFFADEGLEVEIRHAQEGEHLRLLLAGTIQFATANGASVLQRNAEDLPLVSLALIGQLSEQGFAVLADSGIESVADWEGKVLGYKGPAPPPEFYAVASASGLDPASVEQVRVGFDPRVLTEGQVDILPVFFSNEPDTIARLGYETRLFDPNDFGLESLGLTYITSRDFLESDPDTIERFLRAVLRGLQYAEENRDEAVDIVLKFAPREERDHQTFMLNTEFDRALTELTLERGIGWQTEEQWQAMHDTLLEFGAIKKPVDVSTVFTDEFLRTIYE